MIKTIINAFKIADIRKKLLFTAFIILIFRIGSVIPVPFVNIVDGIDVGKYKYISYEEIKKVFM